MTNLLSNFNDYLATEGLSKSSRKNYLSDVRRLLTYLEEKNPGIDFYQTTQADLIPYVSHLKDIEVPEQSQKRYTASINRFLNWAKNSQNLKQELSLTAPRTNIKSTTLPDLRGDHLSPKNEKNRQRDLKPFRTAVKLAGVGLMLLLTLIGGSGAAYTTFNGYEKTKNDVMSFITLAKRQRVVTLNNLNNQPEVLPARTTKGRLEFNVDTQVKGLLEALGGINTNGADIDLQAGKLTASNVLYSITAGENIVVSGGQNLTISAKSTGVSSLQGEKGALELTEGDDISVEGLEISDISTLETVAERGGCTNCILDEAVVDSLTISSDGSISGSAIKSGVLATAYGGTGLTTLGTEGQVLTVSSGALSWSDPTSVPSLPAGAMVFHDGTELAGDVANIYWDDTNNYLGVGTSSPQYTLDVNGNVRLTDLMMSDHTANALEIKQGSDNYLSITTTNSSEAINFGNTSTNPSYNFLGAGQLTISGDLAVNGDANPAAITSDGALTISSVGLLTLGSNSQPTVINGTTLSLNSTGSNNDLSLTAADDIIFDDSNLTSQITLTDTATSLTDGAVTYTGLVDAINAALQGGGLWEENGTSIYYNEGNVGIGTSNPLFKLDVVGNLFTTGTLMANALGIGTTTPSTALHIKNTPIGPELRIEGGLNNASAGKISFIEEYSSLYGIEIAHNAASDYLSFRNLNEGVVVTDNALNIDFGSAGNSYIGIGAAPNDNFKLQVYGSMGIGSSYARSAAAVNNGLVVEGYVGIGTSTPEWTLDITGNQRTTGTGIFSTLAVGTTAPSGSIDFQTAGHIVFNDTNLTSNITLTAGDASFTSGDTGIVDAINAAYSAGSGSGGGAWTDGGNYLYPTSGEYLGNSASDGANKLAGIYLADSAPLTFGTTNDVAFSFDNATSTLNATFANNSDLNLDANTFFIDSSTNQIGIGTTTPLFTLDITGNQRTTGTGIFSTLAVGTTAPAYALDVVGQVKISNLPASSSDTIITSNNGVLESRAVDSRVWGTSLLDGSSLAANYLTKVSDSNTLANSLLYETGGTIGIGTTTPAWTLDVSGNLRTTGTGIFSTLAVGTTVPTGAVTIKLTDNSASNLSIGESGNNYMSISTTNTSENITFGNATTNPSFTFSGTGTADFSGNINLTGDSRSITSSNGMVINPSGTLTAGNTAQDNTFQGANVNITSTGATKDITLSSADDIIFDDTNLTAQVTLTDVDTSLPNANTGIVDAINDAWNAAAGGVGGLWQDGGPYVYLSGNEFIGNTGSDAANKLAGIYLGDNTGTTYGATNDWLVAYDEATDDRLELTTTGTSGMYIASAATTGTVSYIYGSAITTGTVLKIDTASTIAGATLLDVNYNGSDAFTVSDATITNHLPTSFTTAGDVTMAYDLNFTNTTASYINFTGGPGYLRTTHASANNDLTLSAANAGAVIVDDDGLVQEDLVVGADTSATSTLGTRTVLTAFSLGGDDLFVAGTAGIEGNLFLDAALSMGDDQEINFGLDSDFTIKYDSSSTDLEIEPGADGNVSLFADAAASENRTFRMYGYITAGTGAEALTFKVDDTNDEALLDANSGDLTGLAVKLSDASGSDEFRVRDSAGTSIWSVDSDGNVTLVDGAVLDLSAIVHDDSGKQGIKLPQAASLTDITGAEEGFLAWDTDANRISVNDGTNWTEVVGLSTTGSAVLEAEYDGATLSADGSNNVGTMATDNTRASGSSWMNYYDWSSSQTSLQDYDIIVRFTLPNDFTSWATSNAMVFDYVTETTSTADNQIDISVYLESSGSADATDNDNVASVAGTWTTTAIDDSDLGDCNAAGEVCVLVINVQSKDSYYTRIGDITLNYSR